MSTVGRLTRRFRIPLLFVCALAQGMWMGALVHSVSAQALTIANADQQSCACQRAFSTPRSKIVVKLFNATHGTCPVCQLGALSVETPHVTIAAQPAILVYP